MLRHWLKYVSRHSSYLLTSTSIIKSSKICFFFQDIPFRIPLAFMRIYSNNNKKYEKENVTIINMIKYWHQIFEKEKIIEPKKSIEHIIAHVLGISRLTDLSNISTMKLNREQLQKLEGLCQCRLSRMPVQYIIGEWDFRHITLKLEPPIFIPRPETEIIVDISLKRIVSFKNDKCNILEIGCGSGAICLSLLHSHKNINITAIDANSHACELTMRNAQDLQLQDRLILFNAILKNDGLIEKKKNFFKDSINFYNDKFEIIVSNPPYIPTETVFKLQPEIKLYEDVKALDGGHDGLKLILSILKYASEALKIGGFLILEVDFNHPERIEFFIKQNYVNKLKLEYVHKDFANKDRFVEILKIG
ncbi:PREDICTED: hemK methyltransferase family member 1 [Ceratosolen solmsi marchali]|uniref:peptide chain release factor N(5)-glutamine methyltransferase n=1 Tax=Ceratosolen solmsi marchali TaxID=326594 RepID=A0AAJ6YBG8_9HYME|nr:PREDICTED: hemK methyltransferase family member 1 [Ceratosolen solmsi marchali]